MKTQSTLHSRLKTVSMFAVVFLLSITAAAQSRTVYVDAGKVTGHIRSFQGVNGQPTPVMKGLPNLVNEYKVLRIDMVRTHDFMGPTKIDSVFKDDDPLLAWLVPNNDQHAKLVVAGNASIIFSASIADPDKPAEHPLH